MKKLLVFAGALAALVVIGLAASMFFLGSIVRKGVTTVGPRITGTKIELAGARISPLSGSGTLNGFLVGNPPGWQSDRAFYLGEVHLDLEPMSLFGDHIVINEIAIDQPQFVYETRIVNSNIKDLLEHIEKATGSGKPEEPAAAGGVKFVVRKFTLRNAEVTLGVGPAALTVPMPPLTLTDLGVREGGITAEQLAGAVMRSVLASVGTATAQAAGRIGAASGAIATEAVGGAARKAGEGLKKIFGQDEKEKKPEPKR